VLEVQITKDHSPQLVPEETDGKKETKRSQVQADKLMGVCKTTIQVREGSVEEMALIKGGKVPTMLEVSLATVTDSADILSRRLFSDDWNMK